MADTVRDMLVGHATGPQGNFQVTPEGTLVLNAQMGTTETDTLRISNETTSPMSLMASLSGPNAALFSLSSSSISLRADSSTDLGLSFTPLVAGTDSAYLTLRNTAGDSERLMVIGHARELTSFKLTPDEIEFKTRVGVPDTENLTIRNNTATALALTPSLSGSSDFSTSLTR